MERFMRESDAFSWYLEGDPVLRSTVVSVLWFDSAPAWQVLLDRLGAATRTVVAFRQRIVEAPARLAAPRWTVDPDFDLSWHVERLSAPDGAGERYVLDEARREAMTAFDPIRPLWRMVLVEGLEEGRAALIMKVHHSLVDGVGAMQLAYTLFDSEPHPTTVPAARTVAPLRDTLSPVMTGRGTGRHLGYIEVDLGLLREAAHRAGGTVNDGFIAGAAAGLRHYHERCGSAVGRLRVMMPINLRRPDDPQGGNRITLMRYQIPAGEPDPQRLMAEIDVRSRAMRREPSIPHTNTLAAALNLLPPPVVAGIFKHVDFIASDVPGFPEPVWLAGARLRRHVAFGPTTGTAVNMTLLTYCDRCTVGVNMDTAAIADPGMLLDCLRDGFDEVTGRTPAAAGRLQ